MNFHVAAGSVVGAHHRATWRNNQDGFAVVQLDDVISACVCDGCGSSPHSEVGAKLAAEFIARVFAHAPHRAGLGDTVALTAHTLTHRVADTVLPFDDYPAIVRDYFLFTILGFVITPTYTILYGCGDGVFLFNDKRVQLASKDNSPDYITYNLIRHVLQRDPGPLDITVHRTIPSVDLKHIVIATDGAAALPDLGAFMRPVYADNPSLLEKRLRGIALREVPLDDDTTVVAAWRD